MQAAFQTDLPVGLSRVHGIESSRMSGNSIMGGLGEQCSGLTEHMSPLPSTALCVLCIMESVCTHGHTWALCLCHLLAVRLGLDVSLFLPFKAMLPSLYHS